ncbi:uncharacterized protein LOC100880769 [Megachile rotundata]|uniref:uncharacterized protein LOC100880769 n=1 Tax=Megachile rotundata TaxID=143995 RepID=UPI003FD12BCE
MEKITHLWNVNQFITKLNCSQSTNLQTFYIGKCKKLSKGVILPPKNFSPSVMCRYCGSLWNTVEHSIRLVEGKPLSKSIKKIVHTMNSNNGRIPIVRRNLVKKCLKNKRNKLVLKCSVCLQSTKIPFDKPQRIKAQKSSSESTKSEIKKRKKKKTKDRTAGLNISGVSNLPTENVKEDLKEINTKKEGGTSNFITPTPKLKKLNINKLKDIVNHGATPPKRKSLHSFLSEFC